MGMEWRQNGARDLPALTRACRSHTGVQLPINSSSSCYVLAMEAKTAGKFVPALRVRSGAFAKKDLVPGTFFSSARLLETGCMSASLPHRPRSCSTRPRGIRIAAAARTASRLRSGREGYASKDFIVW